MKLATAIAVLCAPLPVLAASGSATASAAIVRPLSLVKTDDLEFGSLVPSAAAGTVTINPNSDMRTAAGGVTGVPGATPSAAHFVGAGQNTLVALVNLPGTITLTRVSGAETMSVTGISSNGPTLRVLPLSGVIDIAVGGTLTVAANQAPGNYLGTFQVTVTYF